MIGIMGKKFFKIDDHATLENLLSDSTSKPVIVFKHSNACSISARAYREMEKLDNVNILEVQSARDVSRELADVTGVRHETPQVIVLRDGKAVWNASHFDVTADDVLKAVESHS
jgi:bacillithiol system protein YtxJ